LLVTHANRGLGIDDHWFSLGDSAILTVMGEIAFMPVLVLCARICPPGVEATLFALLMSIVNLAGLISHELGAVLTHWLHVTETEFDNLWLLVTITNLTTLLPLPLLWLLPNSTSEQIDPEDTQPTEDANQSNSATTPKAEIEVTALMAQAGTGLSPEAVEAAPSGNLEIKL
ncbi:MAG: folate/biopterin family MFS transporter, partial [Cyanobacteria bacterium P01_F01_bin.4]